MISPILPQFATTRDDALPLRLCDRTRLALRRGARPQVAAELLEEIHEVLVEAHRDHLSREAWEETIVAAPHLWGRVCRIRERYARLITIADKLHHLASQYGHVAAKRRIALVLWRRLRRFRRCLSKHRRAESNLIWLATADELGVGD